MKTVTVDDTAYRVRECHELSGSELNKLAGLLEKILTADARALEELVTAFMKILLPDLKKQSFRLTRKRVPCSFEKLTRSFSELP